MIKKSIPAGIAIAIACTVSLSVGGGMQGAFLFSIGLLAVCVMGYALFTGKVCYAEPTGESIKSIAVILAGNLAATILTGLVMRAVKPELIGPAADLCAKKLQESWRVIPLGLFCNILIFFAVDGFRHEDRKNTVSAALMLVLCVMVFILAGFEHSIANSYYLALGGYLQKPAAWGYLAMNIAGNTVGGVAAYRITKT